ncbi:MAG: sigma-70 family RNA polymerase sigma factor [Chloroflexota bacterium]
MNPPSDESLAERAGKGDQAAFAELVRRHQNGVYSLCYRLLGAPAEAEDLAQEAFLRLYRSLPHYRAGAPLWPWLRKLATNACLDALRKRKTATMPLDDLGQDGWQPQVGAADELPEVAYLSREARNDVHEALLRLPPDYRAALVLRYLEDLSYQEVSEALGVPLSTVETRLFRAKKMLGQLLGLARSMGKEGTSRELHVVRRASL